MSKKIQRCAECGGSGEKILGRGITSDCPKCGGVGDVDEKGHTLDMARY